MDRKERNEGSSRNGFIVCSGLASTNSRNLPEGPRQYGHACTRFFLTLYCMTLRHMMIERGGQSEWAENRNGLLHEPASQAKRSRVFLPKLTDHPLQRSYGEVSSPGSGKKLRHSFFSTCFCD